MRDPDACLRKEKKKLIITLIALGILIIGITLSILNKKTDIFSRYDDIDILSGCVIFIGAVFFILCMRAILFKRVGEDHDIELNRMKYESLQRRIEIVKSEYEDVSGSDLIKDINKWNERVYDQKYWAENPWTNWFMNQKVVDELEYIDFERR